MADPAHHFANIGAIVIPFAFIMANAPQVISIVTGILGILWYGALFLDRYRRLRAEDEARIRAMKSAEKALVKATEENVNVSTGSS